MIPVKIPYLPQLQMKREVMWEELSSLLMKRATETVQLSQDQRGIYYQYFLTTKCTGVFCPILKLSEHGTYLRVSKFRIEATNSINIIQGLHQGWWMVSLYLKDANLHVTIHPSHWRCLWVVLRNAGTSLSISGTLRSSLLP